MGLGRLEGLRDLTLTRTLTLTLTRTLTAPPTLTLALALDLGGVAQAVACGGLARRLRHDDAHAAWVGWWG